MVAGARLVLARLQMMSAEVETNLLPLQNPEDAAVNLAPEFPVRPRGSLLVNTISLVAVIAVPFAAALAALPC